MIKIKRLNENNSDDICREISLSELGLYSDKVIKTKLVDNRLDKTIIKQYDNIFEFIIKNKYICVNNYGTQKTYSYKAELSIDVETLEDYYFLITTNILNAFTYRFVCDSYDGVELVSEKLINLLEQFMKNA
jgi:hypothetical protein